MNKNLSRLALGLSATASTASGAIIVFDVNPDLSVVVHQPDTETHIFPNLATGALDFAGVTSSPGLAPGGLAFSGIGSTEFFVRGNDISFAANGTYTGYSPYYGPMYELRVSDYVAGTPLSDGLAFTQYFTKADTATFAVGESRYIALRLIQEGSVYYGWAELFGDAESMDSLKLTRLAFNDVAFEPILAGQTSAVPEASTLGFAGGLFGLVAAAHLRRRKARQAAASDKFLALAAGEKLN